MKKIAFVFVCLLLLSGYSSGQSPQSFKYQAVVRDASGNILPSQAVSFKISIIQTSPSGTVVYTERHSATTNEFGMVNLTIGGGTVLSGSFSSIDWGSGPYFLKVEFDPAGGTNYTVMGTSQLLSVPYALYAANAVPAHYIGELYGGGIVFWVDQTGKHGLIASLTNLASVQWSNVTNTLIGPSAESPWDGNGNSNAIMNQPGHTSSAALVCHNYTGGGYNDWYLPAMNELMQMGNVMYIFNKVLGSDGFVVGNDGSFPFYMSSNESDASDYYAFDIFQGGDDGSWNKDQAPLSWLFIRPVRAF